MVEIGGKPLLWHIMKGYAAYGYREFVVALGYKGEYIKDYFLNYRFRASSLSISLKTGHTTVLEGECEDWTVHLIDTGPLTKTGGRVKRIAEFIGKETFMLTYGDAVSDVDINALVSFHKRQGRLATVTAVRPPARFGSMEVDRQLVTHFKEKPQGGEGWVNGGFFVLEPSVAGCIEGDATMFEGPPLERLAAAHQLAAYSHPGFWQSMDTLRDVKSLEALWQEDRAPWRVWRATDTPRLPTEATA
jgi:glucose-1-phosphate cytidylyltransferase